jgi:hypothetical protein
MLEIKYSQSNFSTTNCLKSRLKKVKDFSCTKLLITKMFLQQKVFYSFSTIRVVFQNISCTNEDVLTPKIAWKIYKNYTSLEFALKFNDNFPAVDSKHILGLLLRYCFVLKEQEKGYIDIKIIFLVLFQ